MSFFQQLSFTNLNAFFELVRSWDLEFRQLDRGQFEGVLLQYGFSEAQIGITTVNRKFDQRGASPERLVSFAMLGPGSPPIMWRGIEVDHHKIMVYGPGDEIDCASEPGFHVMTYSISERLLSQFGRDLGMFRLEETLKHNKIIPVSNRSMQVLQNVISRANRTVGPDGTEVDTEPVRCSLETTIPHLILNLIAETQDIKIRSPLTKRRRRALAAIERALSATHVPTTVRELCQVSGVSERTLQYLFRQKYGIAPKAYLKLVRLNGARRALYKADLRKTKIADIANENGFWHMGQFAKDYKKLFGELPSETFERGLHSVY
jgi:AraC family ethanolamine operon transcriptional activator